MASGRGGSSVRTKFGATIMLMGLVTGLLAVMGPQVSADPITPGSTIGGFEIDGVSVPAPTKGNPDATNFVSAANFAFDGIGTIDWDTVPDLATRLHFDDPFQPGDDGDDLGFDGGDKEFDPAGWSCATDSGDDPPKDDIHYVLAYPSLAITNATVAFGYVREQPEGNTNVVVELNQNSMDSCNAAAGRTVGDLVLHFNFPGGDEAADLEAYVWDGLTLLSIDLPAGVAQAATNRDDLTIPAAIQSVVTAAGLSTTALARTFGEAAIDLLALQAALAAAPDIGDQIDPDVLECPGVGFANIRTRSSGEAEPSQLHDLVPQIPIDLSNCGSLKLKKVDDLGQPMGPGIQFGLFETLEAASDGTPLAQLPSDPPVDLVCTTDAAGLCPFPKVPPGTYFINELNVPDGYTPDPDLPAEVSIDPFEDADLSDDDNHACAAAVNADGCEWFVNSRQTGDVTVTKNLEDADGNAIDLTADNVDGYDDFLVGAQFDLQQGNPLDTADDANGDPLTCTIDSGDINLTTNSASCVFDDVLYGDYVVHETPPQGTIPETNDQAIRVGANAVGVTVSFTNIINPDPVVLKSTTAPVVSAGDQVSFLLTVSNEGDAPALGVVLTDTLNTTITGWSSSQPNPPCAIAENVLTCSVGTVNPGAEFSVTITGTSTPTSCPSITNQASVSSTNETDADAANNNSDVVTVTVNCPNVSVQKSTSTPTVKAGDPVAYAITIANAGPGVAKDVSFTDDLPDGVVWSFNGGPPAGCSLDQLKDLVCSFATMVVGSVTVNLQGTTDATDCPSITNPVSRVSASNEPTSLEGNNATSAVTITVTCETTTTTEPPTTTTTEPPTTTTTEPPTTTTTPPTTATTALPPATVGGEVIVRQPPAVAAVQLPRTGSDAKVLLLLSGMLLMVGGLLVASGGGWAPLAVRRRQS